MANQTLDAKPNSIPVRGIVTLLGTVLALILLLSFKTPDQLPRANLGLAPLISPAGSPGRTSGSSAAVGAAGTSPPEATADAPASATAGARTTPTASPRRGGSNRATATPAPPAATAAPAATPTPATGGTGTFDGPTVGTQFGTVQVEIKVSNGKIVDVQALQLPSDRRRSQSISDYAGPILRTEALQAQSAQIDGVSGATYTSAGYAQSLQGAIDQAHG